MEYIGGASAAALGYITFGNPKSIYNSYQIGKKMSANYPTPKKMRFDQMPMRSTNYPRRPYRNATTARYVSRSRSRYGGTSSFKSKVMALDPAKHYCQTSPTSLTHNTIFTVVPTTGITQGLTNTNRIGDSVVLCALKVRGIFNTNATSGAYSYRIIVGYTSEEYNLPTTLGSGLGSSELFIVNSDTNFGCNGIINPKAFTVLHDETVDINSQIAATLDVSTYGFTVPLNNSTFVYQANGSIQGKTRNLAIVVIGCVVAGSTGITAAGGTTLSYDLIFK